MFKKACPEFFRRVYSKAAAVLARGAYTLYVSTTKGRPCLCEARERRWLISRSLGEGWRLFSTFPASFRRHEPWVMGKRHDKIVQLHKKECLEEGEAWTRNSMNPE